MSRVFSFLLFLHAIGYVYSTAVLQSLPTRLADDVIDGIQGWTPMPTKGPNLEIRGQQYGGIAGRDLFGRQNGQIQTCGWYNADADLAATCSYGYACAYLTATRPYAWQCCPTKDGEVDWDNCPYYGDCYSYDSYSAPNTWTGSYVTYLSSVSHSTRSFYCPSLYPYCNTWFLTDSLTSTYLYKYCQNTLTDWNVYQFTTTPSSSAQPSSSISSAPQQPTVSVVTQTVTKGGKNGGKAAASSSSTSAGSKSTGKGGSSSSTNTGAIAGGVVGGVAGVALIGTAIGYLIYRKRKQRVEPMREVSIYSNNYQNSRDYPNSNSYQQ